MLTWLHIGDLHVSEEDEYESLERLRLIVKQANRFLDSSAVDFAFLPGDNANHGTPEQYARIADVLAHLKLPLHAIPGDHDFESGSLDAFQRMPGASTLPYALDIGGHRCLFLDMVSAGNGGPDFRLGITQRRWLEQELAAQTTIDQRPLVFMHAYPGDLSEDSEYIGRLFADAHVAMVDTGHTHYNEVLNDGAVIYAATRSTGQVEEDDGNAGFSIVAVDEDVVSWRFKPLHSPWPFVLITQPSDHRLVTNDASAMQVPQGACVVRAKIFGEAIASVTVRVDDAPWVTMHRVDGEPAVWAGSISVPDDKSRHRIVVRAQCVNNGVDEDRISIGRGHLAPALLPRAPHGTDHHVVEPWPEHGFLGSQLGPNKGGRKW